MRVAISVDVSHLWIDSLCIIQDDKEDWERQSVQMGRIFGSAYFTIAAIDARTTGTDRGLFTDGDVVPVSVKVTSTIALSYDQVKRDPQDPNKPVFSRDGQEIDVNAKSEEAWKGAKWTMKAQKTSFEMSVERSEWNSRGWVFQERVMSPRVVYFTAEQMMWECGHCIKTEHSEGSELSNPDKKSDTRLHQLLGAKNAIHEGPTSGQPPGPAPSPPSGAPRDDTWIEYQAFKPWWLLVEHYSQCQLTKTTDKWFAIAGLSSSLASVYQTTLEAGIWASAPGAGLLWQARDGPLEPYGDFHSPSWSWLGMNGAVTYLYADESYPLAAQVVRPLLKEVGFTTTSSLQGFAGHASLTCPSRTAEVSTSLFSGLRFREETGRRDVDPGAEEFFHNLTGGRSALPMMTEYRTAKLPTHCRLLLDGGDGRAIGWVVLDTDLDCPQSVVCAAVVMRELTLTREIRHQIVEVLALVPNAAREGWFRRVGRGRVVEYGWLDGRYSAETSTERMTIF